MPEVKHTVRPCAEKARAVNHVSLALEKRLQQSRIFRWIVLQVSILNDDEIAGGFLNATAQGRAFAHILRLQKDPDLRMFSLQLGKNFARSVARSVVHAQQFDL